VPESRLPGIQVDLDLLAAQVQPALDELARAVQDVDLELRKTESTLLLKDAALAAFDAAVAGIGRILTGFDELAGFAEFAEKIRLTLPTRRRRNNGGDEELPPGPESGPDPEGSPETELPPTFAVPEPLTAKK